MKTNKIASFVRENRKAAGLTQEEFAIRSGLGVRFVHDLEQGKETVRLDKVNQALAMFGMEAVPGKMEIKAAAFPSYIPDNTDVSQEDGR